MKTKLSFGSPNPYLESNGRSGQADAAVMPDSTTASQGD